MSRARSRWGPFPFVGPRRGRLMLDLLRNMTREERWRFFLRYLRCWARWRRLRGLSDGG